MTPEQAVIKRMLLTHAHPSATGDISDAVVIKKGNAFMLMEPGGSVPLAPGHGFGLYYLDCRFLNGYEIKVGGMRPTPLVSSCGQSNQVTFQLTNADPIRCGERVLDKQELSLRWVRRIDGDGSPRLEDELCLENLSESEIRLPLELGLSAAFEDIFSVRGLLERDDGPATPAQIDRALRFSREGIDGCRRTATIRFSLGPDSIERNRVRFEVRLKPREPVRIGVTIQISCGDPERRSSRRRGGGDDGSELHWMERESRIHSDSLLLNRALEQSIRDLHMLKGHVGENEFFAAGLPWFGTLFGRDSAITAIQTLAFDPSIAHETLRLLARYQGKRHDAWNDEAPGKILHELRRGELARAGQVPYQPYYGSVDATPLFVILMEQYCEWTADLRLFEELQEHVEAALAWIAGFDEATGSPYVRYSSPRFGKGLVNQGWKDGGNSIVTEDGGIAEPPIALCEVQAYAWRAWLSAASLYRRIGDSDRAGAAIAEARKLRSRFERDFWLRDLGTYAMALHGDRQRPIRVSSSNAGHALWAGIADRERAAKVRDRLMSRELHSGWGIRTLSTRERKYNPVGYHLGTVWPHENSLIAAGFRRYGFDEDAQKILSALLEAASYFEDLRLPETFSGFGREEYGLPVRYPVACHPQAWAAGALPYLVISMLGLVPMAFDRTLRIVRPLLPDYVDRLEIRRVQVADAWVSLRFIRQEKSVAVEVIERHGDLRVHVIPSEPAD